MDIICTMESFGLYEAVVNILSYFNIRVNNKNKVVLVGSYNYYKNILELNIFLEHALKMF